MLKPGTYIFKVKAANNDGVWNEQGRAVTIIITPPFWDTWWCKLLIFLIVSMAMYKFYLFRQKLRQTKMEQIKREEMRQVQLQFFTNISHEFRTPLSLILGPIEKLQKEETSPAVSHNYKVIQSNANRLLSLINELMDFRKSESGALHLNVMAGNLNVFLNEIAEEFSELAILKNMHFSLKTLEVNEVWFDRQVLEKIIINLLSNSFKYTKDNGTITLEVLASLNNFVPSFQNELIIKNSYEGKRYIYLRVADNGIGISKESIIHLFERYYKISESHLGSGVGLAFVKSLALLHKGKIFVYSERNKGTEIIVALPVSKADYEEKEKWLNNKEGTPGLQSIELTGQQYLPVVKEPKLNESIAIPQKKSHILLVDDNEELRYFLKENLDDEYIISEAIDGESGFKKAKEEIPDIIISDVMMPGIDGIEFCKLIKEDAGTSHIPFFILTAKDALQSRLEGVGSGADFYFSKPLSMQLLQLTIKNILAQKQKLREHYLNDQHAAVKDLVHSAKDKEFIDELITAVEAHLTNPDMDVDYICVQMGMSRTKLYTKIKNITGQSINDFIRTIRLKKAVQLMTTEDLPLVDVMYSVGIQTQSYFTKAFKKEFGKTPSQFLKGLNK